MASSGKVVSVPRAWSVQVRAWGSWLGAQREGSVFAVDVVFQTFDSGAHLSWKSVRKAETKLT